MTHFKHVTLGLLAMSSMLFAGGDLGEVEEVEPVVVVPAITESGPFYIGATVAYQRTYGDDSTWFSETNSQDETATMGLLAGYEFNDYIAIEGRFATSVFEEDYASTTSYGLFIKPQYPVTEDFSVYALLGYGNISVDATGAGGAYFGAHPSIIGNTLMDESGFQWGLGVNYAITEHFGLFLDYVSMAADASVTQTPLYAYSGAQYTELSDDTLTFGVTYNF